MDSTARRGFEATGDLSGGGRNLLTVQQIGRRLLASKLIALQPRGGGGDGGGGSGPSWHFGAQPANSHGGPSPGGALMRISRPRSSLALLVAVGALLRPPGLEGQ